MHSVRLSMYNFLKKFKNLIALKMFARSKMQKENRIYANTICYSFKKGTNNISFKGQGLFQISTCIFILKSKNYL